MEVLFHVFSLVKYLLSQTLPVVRRGEERIGGNYTGNEMLSLEVTYITFLTLQPELIHSLPSHTPTIIRPGSTILPCAQYEEDRELKMHGDQH